LDINNYLEFENLENKIKIETTNKWEISNPHGPIKLSSQSTAGVKICYLTSSSCVKMLGQNHFAEPKGHVSTFLHPISFVGPHNEHLLLFGTVRY
jgi:hypothetical protein